MASTYRAIRRLPYPLVELLAVEYGEVFPDLEDAAFESDGACRVDVVTGHHANCNARSLALAYGVWHLTELTYISL